MFKNSSFERKSVKGAQLLEILEIFISHKFLKIKTSLIFYILQTTLFAKSKMIIIIAAPALLKLI